MRTLIIMMMLLSVGSAWANPRPHRAQGQHVCQSQTSIGHSCTNFGINFMDCNQAFYKLEDDDCCRTTKEKGYSIGFKMLRCSSFYRDQERSLELKLRPDEGVI